MNYGIKIVDPINDGKDYYIKGFKTFAVDKISLTLDLQEEFFTIHTDPVFIDILIGLFQSDLDYAYIFNMDETGAATDRLDYLEQELIYAQDRVTYIEEQIDLLDGP